MYFSVECVRTRKIVLQLTVVGVLIAIGILPAQIFNRPLNRQWMAGTVI